MTSALVQGGQSANEIALERAERELGGAAGLPVVAEASAPGMQLAQLGAANLSQAGETAGSLATAMPSGGWFHGVGSFASVNGSSTAPGFTANQGGFIAGLDRPLLPGLIVGIAGGYTHSDVNEHAPASSAADTGRIMAYGGGLLGEAVWAATAGYAHDWISSDRSITGVGTARESHGGNEVTAADQIALPIAIQGFAGNATLAPKTGARVLHLSEEGFAEAGAGGFNLSAAGRSTTSVQPFVGIDVSETFVTAGGIQIAPEFGLTYAREAADNDRTLTVDTLSGANFLVRGVKPSRDMLNARAGLTVRAEDNLFMYAAYDSLLRTGNTVAQTLEAGLRVRF
jgi:fibronectin-binding autotransporter adhesin